MPQITYYHNPRCSKSRQALALLEAKGLSPELRLYLAEPLDKTELKALLQLLDCPVRDLVRATEEDYKRLGLSDLSLSEDALLDAIVSAPKLMQRPIAATSTKAVIGRPPENVLELL